MLRKRALYEIYGPFRSLMKYFTRFFPITWNLRDKNLGSVVLFLF